MTSVQDAAAIVDRGGIVVVPTETVYGLATRPDNVPRIFELKGRSQDRAVQLLVPDASWLGAVAHASQAALRLARAFWPGPLTLVAPAREGAPEPLVWSGTIGVRVPAHPVALALLASCGPLAASSANRAGEPTPSILAEIEELFGDGVDGYLDGGRIEGRGSTVVGVDADGVRVLREGPIPSSEIAAAAGGRFEGA